MKLVQTDDRFALATQRSRAVSDSLRTLARVSRFSSARGRGRAALKGKNRIDTLIWLFVFILPSLAGAAYYGLILAPRYVTDLDFTVRGAEVLGLGSSGGKEGSGLETLSAIDTAQNTMILSDYINSRTVIEDIERLIPLRQIYASPDADWFSRLKPTEPIEELQDYLKKYITASVSSQSYAVHIRIRAFTPEDSLKIAETLQRVCEALMNRLYERSREKAVKEAEAQLRGSERLLTDLLTRMRDLRNNEGMIDPEAAAKQNLAVLLGLEQQKAGVEVRLRTLEGTLSPNAPSMRQLRDERTQLERAIAEQRRAMTSLEKSARLLSASMQRFDTLKVEQQAAEKSYMEMLRSYQIARIQAERQQVFLNTVVPPRLPESPLEPYRLWYIGVVCASAAAAAIVLSALRRSLSA